MIRTTTRRSARYLLAAGALAAGVTLIAPAVPASSAAPAAVPLCFGRPATKVVARAGEHTRGTPGDDVIVGFNGDGTQGRDDTIEGLGGNDRICSLGGNDRVLGDDGNDMIAGGANSDGLLGGRGNDVIGCGIDFSTTPDVDVGDGGPGVDSLNFGPQQADCEVVRSIP
jgi:Ca2+-binding RTX toxin-like protein